MKAKTLIFGLIISGLSFLSIAPAQAQVEQVATDSGVEYRQGTTVDNNIATIMKPPTRINVLTKTLLEDLALDETLAGKWFEKFPNKVPPNAKVEVIFPSRAGFSSLSYRVASGTNVVDVSNILSASATGTNDVQSKTLVDTNGFEEGPFSFTDYHEFTITYDARPIEGQLWFQVTGLATCSTKAGKTNPKTGKFLETDTFSLTDGTGAGIDPTGTTFLLGGVTVTASGSAVQEPLRFATALDPSGVTDSETGLQEISIGAGDEEINAPAAPVQVAH